MDYLDKVMVTVVITTCQREPKLVFRAIDSVINQSYKNWELFVVDDSPYNYFYRSEIEERCNDLVKSYSVFYIANEKNSGACFSRNIGLNNASGKYIAYLDDDDEWLPEKLEKQVESLESASYDTSLVYCLLYKKNDETGDKSVEELPLYSGFLYDKLMEEGNFIGGMSIPLMKTEAVRKVGGFDELMQSAQDQDLWLRLAKHYKFISIKDVLVVCHMHRGGQISTNPQKKIAGLERLFEKNIDYLEKHKKVMWSKIIALIPYYLAAKKKRQAYFKWKQAVLICPGQIPRNTKELFRIVTYRAL